MPAQVELAVLKFFTHGVSLGYYFDKASFASCLGTSISSRETGLNTEYAFCLRLCLVISSKLYNRAFKISDARSSRVITQQKSRIAFCCPIFRTREMIRITCHASWHF